MPENGAHGGCPRRSRRRASSSSAAARVGLDPRPVDREPELARASAPRADRATVPSPAGRSGWASRLHSSPSRRVSPIPIASPSPGGWGAGWAARPSARWPSAPGAAWTRPPPPRFWTITEERVRRPQGAPRKIRAAGRRYLDGRDLLVLGDAEGRPPAAARGHDVRVVHPGIPRPGANPRSRCSSAVDVREALVVDEDAQAVVLEDRRRRRAGCRRRGDNWNPGAAAAAHADPQAGEGQVGVLGLPGTPGPCWRPSR